MRPESVYLVINAANADADLAWMREHTDELDCHAGNIGECWAQWTEELASLKRWTFEGTQLMEFMADLLGFCRHGDHNAAK